jgi:hypothetical protein
MIIASTMVFPPGEYRLVAFAADQAPKSIHRAPRTGHQAGILKTALKKQRFEKAPRGLHRGARRMWLSEKPGRLRSVLCERIVAVRQQFHFFDQDLFRCR